MAVLMVTGNAAVMPHSCSNRYEPYRQRSQQNSGEAPQGGVHYKALFALGCILFLLTMLINLWVESISENRNAIVEYDQTT